MNDQPENTEERVDDLVAGTDEGMPKVKMTEARSAASLIPVGKYGTAPENLAQSIDYFKVLATTARSTLPPHLLGLEHLGDLIMLRDRALEWGFSLGGIAPLTQVINGRLGYQAQLWVAVANKHGRLKQRLRARFEGKGDDRVCFVTGHFEGEVDPCEYESPPFGKIQPKNSPLWKNDPDQQHWYFSARAFCRRYCPHIMLGVYGIDELIDHPEMRWGPENARDVTPAGNGAALHERLKAAAANGDGEGGEGFSQDAAEEVREQAAPKGRKPGKRSAAKEGSQEPAAETRTTEAAKPAAGPSDDAAQQQAKADPAKPPKNLKQYRQWVLNWLQEHEDVDEIETRWAGKAERDLRNKCGVTSEDKAEIRGAVDERIARLEAKS